MILFSLVVLMSTQPQSDLGISINVSSSEKKKALPLSLQTSQDYLLIKKFSQ